MQPQTYSGATVPLSGLRYGALERWHNFLEHALFLAVATSSLVPDRLRGSIKPRFHRVLKRSIDLVGSVVGLILAAPLFVLVAIVIKLDSPGPVFYRQLRVGRDRRKGSRRILVGEVDAKRRGSDRRQEDEHGQAFMLLKFRSMVENAERSCGPVWASKNDPRITRLGSLLRRSRIDEIPQLLNVFRGQMSLVGPRPERPHFVSKFKLTIDNYGSRHVVKPGITGLAQIENGYDVDESDVTRKVAWDLRYIERWNAFLDIHILIRTVRVVLTGRGAH
jgi:lipopolysaccharide/colanic/teichoic acid biosynthesis glycosyltransferase